MDARDLIIRQEQIKIAEQAYVGACWSLWIALGRVDTEPCKSLAQHASRRIRELPIERMGLLLTGTTPNGGTPAG